MDTALVWFRNDLRVQDNISLLRAQQSGKRVVGVYCFDPRHFETTEFGFKKTEKYRAQFLIETVTQLKQKLAQLNITLLTYYSEQELKIPQLVTKYNITEIHSQREWTTEEVNVSTNLESTLNRVAHHTYYDQFLFHPEDIPFTSFNEVPHIYTQFRKKCEKESTVRPMLEKLKHCPKENALSSSTDIPSLQALGLEPFKQDHRSAFPWSGGEDVAWDRLNHYFWTTKKLASYKKTRNGLIGKDYSSKFSAYLANGSISARQIYWEVKRFEKEIKKNQDTYWLIFELIWRDYFKYISLKHGNKIFKIGGIHQKDYDWKRHKKAQREWIQGTTQYDFVNANMVELKETGWMSNRGRQNVASFWAKEQEQDWRVGAAYFESMLIDYDVHSNWGNWMYNAGVGNDPRDRRFNIKSQQERYDKDGKFVRLWTQKELF